MTDDNDPDSSPRMGAHVGALGSRMDLQHALGETFDGDRNLYDTLGYEETPTVTDYRQRYFRQDTARTIVDKPAKATWREAPELTDDDGDDDTQTGFERDVETLFREHELLSRFEAVDRLAGIGHFGVLVLGFRDGKPLNEPVEPGSLAGPSDVAYLMPLGEDRVDSWALVEDETDERFGLPERYSIDFSRDDKYSERTTDDDIREVHYSRVVHVPAGNTLDNQLFGRPRLEAVYNRLQDLEKVVGASAEYMWRAADYGLALKADPEHAGQLNEDQRDRLEDEIEAWYHDLQPFMRLSGMDVERLGGGETDPTGIVEQLLKLIAGETGIPQRILTGSERGELASTQDRASWLGRVAERQQNFAEPKILRATFDRFIEYGAVADPSDGYDAAWPNLFELSEVERAEVAQKLAAALKQTRRQGSGEPVMSQGEVRAEIFGLDPELGSEVDIDENLPEQGLPDDARDMLPPDQREDGPPDPPDEVDEDDPEIQEQFELLRELDGESPTGRTYRADGGDAG
jgi:hypothetical protein